MSTVEPKHDASGDVSSDEELYNPCKQSAADIWEPDPKTIADLYEKLDKVIIIVCINMLSLCRNVWHFFLTEDAIILPYDSLIHPWIMQRSKFSTRCNHKCYLICKWSVTGFYFFDLLVD